MAVWLDDLARDLIRSGNLQSLVDDHLALPKPVSSGRPGAYLTLGVVGVAY